MRVSLIALALGALAGTTVGQGVVFDQQGTLEIESYRTIVSWHDGEQVVVFEHLHGETKAGVWWWLLPVPAEPTSVGFRSSGVFDTLNYLSTCHARRPDIDALAILCAVGLLIVGGRRIVLVPGRVSILSIATEILVYVGAIVVLGLVVQGFSSTAMGTVELCEPATAGSCVVPHDNDVVLVSVGRPSSLVAQLSSDGYPVTSLTDVAREWERDGWLLCLLRMTVSGERIPAVRLAFPSERPVILGPLGDDWPTGTIFVLAVRGVWSSSLRVASQMSGFSDDSRIDYRELPRRLGHPLPLAHSDLNGIPGLQVVTKLEDVVGVGTEACRLHWKTDVKPETPVWSWNSAVVEGLTYGAWLSAVWGGLVWLARKRFRRQWPGYLVGVLLGIAVGCSTVAIIEVVPTRTLHVIDAIELQEEHLRCASMLAQASSEVDGLRARAGRFWSHRTNPLTGGPVTECASPGNYMLRYKDGKVEYCHYDASGAEWRVGIR